MSRILTVVYMLGKGGTERAAQNFAEAYYRLGHDSRVLATEGLGVRAEELKALGIIVYKHDGADVIEQIKIWSPELIHIHSHEVQKRKIDALLSRLSCKPAIVETNVFSIPSQYEQYLTLSFQLSEWCNWGYQKQTHVAKHMIIPNPVNTDNFYRPDPVKLKSFRSYYNIGADDIVVGRIGQHFFGKWSYLLVDSFRLLCDMFPNLKLLVVNPPDEIIRQISCQPDSARKKITCIDQIAGDDNLRLCYSAIDIFVHIADQGESFGMALAEAMLCETPIVTYSTPWGDNSQCEVVGNNVGGLVVTNNNDLIRAVDRLIRDAILRKSFGRAGRARILGRYDAIRLARQVMCLLNETVHVEENTLNRRICRIYMDVYGGYSKLVLLMLFFMPRGKCFSFFKRLICLVSYYRANSLLKRKILAFFRKS